jgi:hypothetical protein
MYLGFMQALGVKYLIDYTQWQLEDYKTAITNYKTMWHRSRRGGKSIGLSVLAVFFSIIQFGYRANAGCVVWRAPYTDQLYQAQKWLKMNPFVTYIDKSQNDIYVLDSEYIDMSCLSSGKVASRGVSVFIMDEYKKVNTGSVMMNDAKEAYGMLAEGPNDQKRMVSASTGARMTEFFNQYLSDEWEYCVHDWRECEWITDDFIESERRGNPQDPYYVPQEYECMWVARGDTAYRNVYIIDTVEKTIVNNENTWDFGDHPFFPEDWTFPSARKAGVDFNDSAGHYIVAGSEDDEAIYVNSEHVVTTVTELKSYGRKYRMEIESGPFEINITNARKCREQGVRATHRNWDKDTIARRFRKSMDKMIIIDKRLAPYTLKNLMEAVFDQNARESKLKKQSDQHGLDALLHMIHRTVFKIHESTITTNIDPNYVEHDMDFGIPF